MPAEVQSRFLDPAVLAGISQLELIARTVVEGFITGLHRSPDFGISQEFAEYRSYTPGDDLRHVDWNVYARTERAYIKRYHGETNTRVFLLLDTSASMGFASGSVSKLAYAKFLAAAVVFLASLQRDSAGLLVFHDDVCDFVPPSGKHGQLNRLLHAIDKAALGHRTDYARPFAHTHQFLKTRGIVVVISDFFTDPDEVIRSLEPLRFQGNEVLLFHVLDRRELQPVIAGPVLLQDAETGDTLEVSADYARTVYPQRIQKHIADLKQRAHAARIEHVLVETDRPLDAVLREYFALRKRKV